MSMIRQRMATTVPFVGTVGIEIVEITADGATAALSQRDCVSNHIDSMHAGALFTLGETASGAAMSGAFAARMLSIQPVATAASIRYLALAKSAITAHARIDGAIDELIATLDATGRVAFDVEVSLLNGDDRIVAEMTVSWLIKQR